MRKKAAFTLLAGSAAMAISMIVAPAALAATDTWSVSPSGSYTASLNTGTTTILKNTTTDLTLSCTSSAVAGSLVSSATGSPATLGTITSVTWSTCTGLGGLVSAGSATGNATATDPWDINGVSYSSTVDDGQTTGTITGTASTGVGATLNLTIAGSSCTATVGGTTTAVGSAAALYGNTNKLLAVTGTTNLKVLTSDCTGLSVGNGVSFYTSPTSTAGTTITHGYAPSTSPTITETS
jgi:hypothetical protein